MAERETREQAQERILGMQSALAKRMENNETFKSLSTEGQMQAMEMLMPRLFNPSQRIAELLEDIKNSKFLIRHYNTFAAKYPEDSETWAEGVEIEQGFIREYVAEIQRIRKGDFEWVVR